MAQLEHRMCHIYSFGLLYRNILSRSILMGYLKLGLLTTYVMFKKKKVSINKKSKKWLKIQTGGIKIEQLQKLEKNWKIEQKMIVTDTN